MEHRHISNQFMIPGYYQHEINHPPVGQSHISMVTNVAIENGHFVHPIDHTIQTRFNPNEYHSSNINMEMQHITPHLSIPPFDPHTHAITNRNTSFAPVGPVGHTRGISESGGPHKRKTPFFDGAESSSSSHMQIQNPLVNCLNQPPYWGSNLAINVQDSFRNVRTRSGPELEPCWSTRVHVPNYVSQIYQPTTHFANYSVPVHPVSQHADVIGQDLNVAPFAASYNAWTSYQDINHARIETTQFYGRTSSVDNDVSNHNPFIRGNVASSSQNPQVSHVQPTRDEQSYHYQRVTPFYRNNNVPNNGIFLANELHFPSQHLSSNNNAASGSQRGGNSHDGFEYETVTVDHESFDDEEMDFPDPYEDLRLDIDSMSYEELLALEESIGYVNNGLSEYGLSKCLKEKIYISLNQNHDPCPICLEEFKNGEKIGRMEYCGHEYHVDCIKKWVVMKKVCPICKSEC